MLGTLLNITMTVTVAYPLSSRRFSGRYVLMIFLDDQQKYPLQLVLRSILILDDPETVTDIADLKGAAARRRADQVRQRRGGEPAAADRLPVPAEVLRASLYGHSVTRKTMKPMPKHRQPAGFFGPGIMIGSLKG